MNEGRDRELMRLLCGELAPEAAAALRRRLSEEPDLAAAYRRLEGLWESLELPPPAAAPGLARRVAERAAASPSPAPSLAAAPLWVRAAAALCLAAGMALGAAAGLLPDSGDVAAVPSDLWGEPAAVPFAGDEEMDGSFADAYWRALEAGWEDGAGARSER